MNYCRCRVTSQKMRQATGYTYDAESEMWVCALCRLPSKWTLLLSTVERETHKIAAQYDKYGRIRGVCCCGWATSWGATWEATVPAGDVHLTQMRDADLARTCGVPLSVGA